MSRKLRSKICSTAGKPGRGAANQTRPEPFSGFAQNADNLGMRADRFVDEFNSTWLMGWHDECADLVPDMPAGSLLKALQGVHPGNRLANKQVLEQIKLALTKTSQDVHRFVLACERKLSYPVDALPFIAWRQAMLEDHLKGVLAQNPKETGWQEAAVDVFLGPEGGPTAQALGSRMAALADQPRYSSFSRT